jgi:dynein heavy chain
MYVQELPEEWNNLKKIVITLKQTVAPLQANEVNNIRKKSATFDVLQHQFREEFRKIAAYMYSCTTPYQILDQVCSN